MTSELSTATMSAAEGSTTATIPTTGMTCPVDHSSIKLAHLKKQHQMLVASSEDSSAPPTSDESSSSLSSSTSTTNSTIDNKSVDRADVPDTSEHFLMRAVPQCSAKVIQNSQSHDVMDIIPGMAIPSTGRGNSQDGEEWLNPSANQLFNALKRKDKPIEYEDALSVAHVHSLITSQTWQAIMQYENMHYHLCTKPKLARFAGRDGYYSPKARFFHKVMGSPLPYDRHDWTVDRCGKEVDYVIDYYAYPIRLPKGKDETTDDNDTASSMAHQTEDGHLSLDSNNSTIADESVKDSPHYADFIKDDSIDFVYSIDARPKLNRTGAVFDRIRMAFKQWREGEQWF